MSLSGYADALSLLGDESRLRLCALLNGRELCVTDLVSVTGISQSRVSTHLGRLRDAKLVRDRRQGTQCFYELATDILPNSAQVIIREAVEQNDVTIVGDRKRLAELEAARRIGTDESISDSLERDYSPGRTWQSLAVGIAALLRLGDVLDAGSGDGAAAASLAPYCRSLTCIDTNPQAIEAAGRRLRKFEHVRAEVADVHELPFDEGSFDAVLLFHTLTYAEHPARALGECARVLRKQGRLVVLCLDQHQEHEVSARHGERHAGFSPRAIRGLLTRTGLDVISAETACREVRKPHLQVVLAIADKPGKASVKRSSQLDR
jgi:SAM-dependent methyltransferase